MHNHGKKSFVITYRDKSAHGVFVPVLFWVIRLPPTGGKDVLVTLVPCPQNNLTSMGLRCRQSGETLYIIYSSVVIMVCYSTFHL